MWGDRGEHWVGLEGGQGSERSRIEKGEKIAMGARTKADGDGQKGGIGREDEIACEDET